MNLNEYFENTEGLGILSTADTEGNIDCAIYATPHVMGADSIAFIMRHRLSYENVRQNPKAVYMYVEKGPGYQGRRLYLEKTDEEQSPEYIEKLRRSHHGDTGGEEKASLVYFKVTRIRPLVGDGK